MAGWHHGLDGRESEWTLGVGDGQGVLACCNSWGRKESDTTERLNWAELNLFKGVENFLLDRLMLTKTDRLIDMSSAIMCLLGIGRELQFGCLQSWWARSKSPKANEKTFYGGEKRVGRATINRVLAFSWAELLPGKKRSLSSSCWALLLLWHVRAPLLVSWFHLTVISVYLFIFYHDHNVYIVFWLAILMFLQAYRPWTYLNLRV